MSCDPFEMALVHSGFRRELHNAAGLVRGVTDGDRNRAAVVADHIDFMMTAVHFHHTAEDSVVWPKLTAKVSDRAERVGRMEDAHRAIDVACQRVRETTIGWGRTADSSLAEELVPLVEGLAELVDAHFDDEEDTVVPLIATSLSPNEWRRFLAHGWRSCGPIRDEDSPSAASCSMGNPPTSGSAFSAMCRCPCGRSSTWLAIASTRVITTRSTDRRARRLDLRSPRAQGSIDPGFHRPVGPVGRPPGKVGRKVRRV